MLLVCSFEYCGKQEQRLHDMEAHISAVHLQYLPFVCLHNLCVTRKPTALTCVQHQNIQHPNLPIQMGCEADQAKSEQLYAALERSVNEHKAWLGQASPSPINQSSTLSSALSTAFSQTLSPPSNAPKREEDTSPQPILNDQEVYKSLSSLMANALQNRMEGAPLDLVDDNESVNMTNGCHEQDTWLGQTTQQAIPQSFAALAGNDADGDPNFRFNCSKCDKRFVTSRSFWAHWKRHRVLAKRTGDRPFECTVCPPPGQFFATQRALACHMCVTHKQKFERECETCGKLFVSRAAYNTHLKQEHGICPYECDVCGKRFHNSGSLRAHEVLHETNKQQTDDRSFGCDICQQWFKSQRGLSNHIVRAHGVDYEATCAQCAKTFVSRASYSSHLSLAHGIAQYRCESCNMDMKSERQLRIHRSRWCLGQSNNSKSTSAITAPLLESGADLDDHLLAPSPDSASSTPASVVSLNRAMDSLEALVVPNEGAVEEGSRGRRKSARPTRVNKQEPCNTDGQFTDNEHVCTECKTSVPREGVWEHIMRVHMSSACVQCPVPNCLFTDAVHVGVVSAHLRATHAPPYCEQQPVDVRGQVADQWTTALHSLFPAIHPINCTFQQEMHNFDARNSVKSDTSISTNASSSRKRGRSSGAASVNGTAQDGGVCRACGRFILNRAKTSHVYMEMFHYDKQQGRYKCSQCWRTSSGRGALQSHYAVTHGPPGPDSIEDRADQLLTQFQHWHNTCFGALLNK